MDGIYLIDKPEGISSYDCIRKLKKALDFKKIGHSGTLDPFASGLLVVLVGKATKLANIFLFDDKEYIGTIYFGRATDSYDKTGNNILETKDFYLDDELINAGFKSFIGKIKQKPPLYSAVRYQGKKLYEYARNNEEVDIKARNVYINRFNATSQYQNNKINFVANVSKGTYLRSLAFDLGVKLNVPAHLFSLRRTKSGIFDVKDAYKMVDIIPGIKPTITINEYAETLESLIVEPYLEKHVLNGIQLDTRQSSTKNIFAVYNKNKTLLAIYKPTNNNKYNPLIIQGE